MIYRFLLSFILGAILILALSGCGGGDYEEEDGQKSVPSNPCISNPERCV